MIDTLVGSYIGCLSIGLLLSAVAIYRDARPILQNHTSARLRWHVALLVFDLFQLALFLLDGTALIIPLVTTIRISWIELAISCTLQVDFCTNVGPPSDRIRLTDSLAFPIFFAIALWGLGKTPRLPTCGHDRLAFN